MVFRPTKPDEEMSDSSDSASVEVLSGGRDDADANSEGDEPVTWWSGGTLSTAKMIGKKKKWMVAFLPDTQEYPLPPIDTYGRLWVFVEPASASVSATAAVPELASASVTATAATDATAAVPELASATADELASASAVAVKELASPAVDAIEIDELWRRGCPIPNGYSAILYNEALMQKGNHPTIDRSILSSNDR